MKQLSVTNTHHERLWGTIYLAIEILVLPVVLGVSNLFFGLDLPQAELNFLYFSINLFSTAFIFRHLLLENSKIALQKIPAVLIVSAAGYVIYMLFSFAVTTTINTLYPAFYNFNDIYISTMVKDRFALMFLGTVIFVPIAEELIYRGLIFCGLHGKNKPLAYILSISTFSFLHVYGYIGQYSPLQLLLCLVEYIPAGLCLCWAYARTDTIITPILIHMFINFTGTLAMR